MRQEAEVLSPGQTFAEIRLVGFNRVYQKSSRKMSDTIARDLLEHCLWYFVREGGAPDIVLIDNGETTDLREKYEGYMRSSAMCEEVVVDNKKFEIIHLKLKAGAKVAPHLNWCAANRVVVEESISGKIPGLHGVLTDKEGEFIYAGYLTSPFLDDHVRPERTEFDLEETAQDAATGGAQESLLDEEPSKSEIREAVLRQVEGFLRESLTTARETGRGRVEDFVSQKAPRYRPILRRIDETGFSIDPNLSDRDLELELHKRLTDLEAEVLRRGRKFSVKPS